MSGAGHPSIRHPTAGHPTTGHPIAPPAVVQHLVVGPQRHGVVRHGLGLAAAAAAASGEGRAHRLLRGEIGDAPAPGAGGILHVSFTDHLFGPGPEAAVDAVLELAEGALLSVGVHDVPQPEEGRERFARRAAAYGRLIGAAEAVIANSRHEAAQLLELCPQARGRIHVVPLPLEQPAAQGPTRQGGPAPVAEAGAQGPVVGLLGFVYPGKGYEAVVEAVPAGTRLRALGAVAEGHGEYADGLAARAAQRGVGLEITGFVPDADLARALAAVDVPVCPHRHVSASGSLNTWIAHGRVPLALAGPYMLEVARRWPGRLLLCAPDELPARLGALLRAPRATRSAAAAPDWGWPQVAAACEDVWGRLLP